MEDDEKTNGNVTRIHPNLTNIINKLRKEFKDKHGFEPSDFEATKIISERISKQGGIVI